MKTNDILLALALVLIMALMITSGCVTPAVPCPEW